MDADREDAIHARSRAILERQPSPEDVAEQEERARRNKVEAIMARPSSSSPTREVIHKVREDALLPPPTTRNSGLEAKLKEVVRGLGKGMAQYVKGKLAPLIQDIEQNRKSYEAVGQVADRVSNELAALRREFDLERKLESQRNKRRVEALEIQLLAAGRNPAERDDEAEGEIPKMDWRGQHAQ